MTFKFGTESEANLVGVHPDLVAVVRKALTFCDVDFTVFEGLRSKERQAQLYAKGVSRTLNSFHLTGDAVDLVPYVGGRVQWQMPLCNEIADAMHHASVTLGVPLVWGRVWDKQLEQLSANFEGERAAYVARYQSVHGLKSWPLDDGPHFQRVR